MSTNLVLPRLAFASSGLRNDPLTSLDTRSDVPLFWLTLGFAALAGIVSHLAYFIRGEHHLHVTKIFGLATTTSTMIALLQVRLCHTSTRHAIHHTFLIQTTYAIALFTSMIIYRLWFHSLHHFPGPKAMKITKFAHIWKSRRLDNHLQLDDLREQYGDIVRTGPNELTMFRADAHLALHGRSSRCTKAAWYDIMHPITSLHMTRSQIDHDRRRKAWDHAFSARAIFSYGTQINTHINLLERRLASAKGQAVNMTKLFKFFSFDVMGDISFGTRFNMLNSGKTHFVLDILNQALVPVGILFPVPWLFRLLVSIPEAMRPGQRLIEWSKQEAARRLEVKGDLPDIISWISEAVKYISNMEEKMSLLAGDAMLAVTAGSDPPATIMTFLFYYLTSDQTRIQKVREELSGVTDIHNDHQLQALPYLNALITETLRLHPVTPSGLARQTPPEGITIAGQHIPGDITCVAPMYSIARLESCFTHPDAFIPERWTTAPHLIKDKTGYAPFSIGPYSCIGKNLALMELRLVTAALVNMFDIAFAPDEDVMTIFSQMRDHFTIAPGPLKLVFEGK